MTSIICPNCKSRVTEFDLSCVNCGYTVTQEERKKLIDEMIKAQAPAEDLSAEEKAHKLLQEHKLEKKLNKFSVGLFKVGFAEMIVPLLIILLIIIVIAVMFL